MGRCEWLGTGTKSGSLDTGVSSITVLWITDTGTRLRVPGFMQAVQYYTMDPRHCRENIPGTVYPEITRKYVPTSQVHTCDCTRYVQTSCPGTGVMFPLCYVAGAVTQVLQWSLKPLDDYGHGYKVRVTGVTGSEIAGATDFSYDEMMSCYIHVGLLLWQIKTSLSFLFCFVLGSRNPPTLQARLSTSPVEYINGFISVVVFLVAYHDSLQLQIQH